MKYVYKDHQKEFQTLAQNEIALLHEAFPTGVIEHFGSTSIPGVRGKGIIDIYLAVNNQLIPAARKIIGQFGYDFKQSGRVDDGSWFYQKDKKLEDDQLQRFHVHLTYPGNENMVRCLYFRDFLRNHPAEAKKGKTKEEKMNKDTLSKRTFEGLAQFLIVLWLLIFLPIWTLSYWPGWAFFITFSISVTLITLYFLKKDPKLIESRLKGGTTAETEMNQKIIQVFASIFFLSVVLFPGIDHRFGWSTVPMLAIILGDILVALGLYIVFLVFKENTFTSAIIEVSDNQTVISSGPYAIIRHPMYAGAFIMLLGLPIALGSWISLIFTCLLCGTIIERLQAEEKYLNKNLSGYKEYLHKVKYHLIPLVW